ncbi:MAG: hypothetical protein J5838_00535 [Desulfovibrio sp.]|nr:hypothetical protein [Desulfovibrio sp.]MCR5563345.1 hypothetical protein [Desulfovibrio sp.]
MPNRRLRCWKIKAAVRKDGCGQVPDGMESKRGPLTFWQSLSMKCCLTVYCLSLCLFTKTSAERLFRRCCAIAIFWRSEQDYATI